MSAVRIQGIGWVTPAGRDLASVWSAVRTGAVPPLSEIVNPFDLRVFPVWRVDPAIVADAARLPRLRRSSAISHFAVTAALDALRDSGCDPARERLGVVFAATNGGVIYTRRFFEEVSKSGTQAGSPLLFPETVYNAPASHIAAVAGITGTVTTIINDATAAIHAISAACDLLDSGTCDRCLVVAAEEADWAICEAYAAWNLSAPEGTAVPLGGSGAIFAEGAAALLLGSDGDGPAIERILDGGTFASIADARKQVAAFAKDAAAQLSVCSASGTLFDDAEADLRGPRIFPKAVLGEAFATSALTQVACAALALREHSPGARAFVSAVGFSGQAAALTLRA